MLVLQPGRGAYFGPKTLGRERERLRESEPSNLGLQPTSDGLHLLDMASNLLLMASNLIAMAFKLASSRAQTYK